MSDINRKQWIVNLRTIACIMVVFTHVISGWLDIVGINGLNDYQRIIDVGILQLACRSGVSLFLLISGYLLLDKDKSINISKQKKYIFKMIFVLLTFGYLFCLIEEYTKIGFSNIPLLFINSFVNLLSEKCWGHMWYIYMLIGIYIILPVIKSFINYEDKKTQLFIICTLFIVSIVIPTINRLFGLSITSFRLDSLTYITVFVCGYYIGNDYNNKHNKYYYLGGLFGLTMFLLLYIKLFNLGFMQNNMFIILFAIAIFRLFSVNKKQCSSSSRFSMCVAKYSFIIYIIHPFYINLLYKVFHYYPDKLPIVIGELMILVLIFILSYISAIIISKLPFIGKRIN